MKKLDSIQDFIAAWEPDSNTNNYTTFTDWRRRFEEAGYFKVNMPFKGHDDLIDAIHWCDDSIGAKNYAYISYFYGFIFYFQTEKEAMFFALRWS